MIKPIGFLVYPGFNLLDLSGPLVAMDTPQRLSGQRSYELSVVSANGGAVRSSSGVEVFSVAYTGQPFDTFVVVGGNLSVDPVLFAIAREAAASARRVASVCTGAFILAAAGLLDDRPATTHWSRAAELQRRYPRIKVDGDRIFTRDEAIWTSAGITAGIDLALALIEDDLGIEASQAAARQLVVYHRRHGGQSQYSTLLDLSPPSERINKALCFAREHLDEDLSVDRLAEVACLSRRQFDRAFVAEAGQTPAKAIERLRAEAAKARIETGGQSLEAIARAVGFGDPERMRRACIRLFGLPPQALKRKSRVL